MKNDLASLGSASAPSMETIAAAAGVATSTVSRALKGDARISPQTSRRIREITERLGYRPNPLVSALMTQLRYGHPPVARCNLAWLDFFPGPEDWRDDPVQVAFWQGAQRQAQRLGYAINRIRTQDKSPKRLAGQLHSRGIQGVLVPPFDESDGLATTIPLPLDSLTIVGVGTRFEKPALHYSSDDQFEYGRMAVQKLWERGYRRIGYVGEPRVEKFVNGRFFAGYYSTLCSELGGTPLPPLVSARDDDAIEWLRQAKPDVIVTANRRLLSVLRKAGLRVPDDVALAHLNIEDVEGASAAEVAGIRQDNVGVGANAVELLVSLLYQNESGIPVHPRGIQVHGVWVDGPTVSRPKPERQTATN
ncbi:LacI family DNA-binding transcriptional regulator [Actomonas aquatica]|uniref:LacI family DNA-binding transcriptional regulator n=1 Tax=Actomonas aquatica TaxID=2866162 RepID=A0ABZ1C617_9BACT|nr:LacI family DNA-binding transcriptional regulator [Opitutus sp. WL0086]WRQ85740.1 LacI family DNA-binding transcriptional regulator [Opitutus sp. WL0086]